MVKSKFWRIFENLMLLCFDFHCRKFAEAHKIFYYTHCIAVRLKPFENNAVTTAATDGSTGCGTWALS